MPLFYHAHISFTSIIITLTQVVCCKGTPRQSGSYRKKLNECNSVHSEWEENWIKMHNDYTLWIWYIVVAAGLCESRSRNRNYCCPHKRACLFSFKISDLLALRNENYTTHNMAFSSSDDMMNYCTPNSEMLNLFETFVYTQVWGG